MAKSQKNNLKLAFAGSGPFAEPIFESLAQDFSDLILIVKVSTPKDSGICLTAKKYGKKVLKTTNKEEFHIEIQKLKPDIAIVVSFGIIIPQNTLNIPKYGFVNVHYSLLPRYRGPSPVQAAILAGDKTSGITFQKMAPMIDEGDILYQEEVQTKENDTTETLARRMAKLSAKKLSEVITQYIGGNIEPKKQKGEPSYSKIITKKDGRIDWLESAEEIERKVRAYTPWPSAYTFWDGKMLKILEADVLNSGSSQKPGTFYEVSSKKHGIQTGRGTLTVKKIQLEGKKSLKVSDFLLGNSKIIGDILG